VETKLKKLTFTPIEAKLIFNLDHPPASIQKFCWNIQAGFIQGLVDSKMIIYPPRVLVGDFMSTRIWNEYPVITSSLEFINKLIGSPQLLIKIVNNFKDEFHYLSPGQAKAIIKRKLRFSLSSGERNDLSRLRKKFEGYRIMIRTFEHLVDKKPEVDEFILPGDEDRFAIKSISKVHFKLRFVCMECGVFVEYPDTEDQIIPPEHHGKPMILNWGISLSAKEPSEGTLELSDEVAGVNELKPIDFSDDVRKQLLARTNEMITMAHALKVIGDSEEVRETAGSISDKLESIDFGEYTESEILKIVIDEGRRLIQIQKTFLLEDPSPETFTTFVRFNLKLTNLIKLSNIV
jgi:hypothetical protein